MPDLPRWVAAGIDAVPDDVLTRFRDTDDRGAMRRLDDRLLPAIVWHPPAAGVLLAFVLAFPLVPLALGAGTTWGTIGVLSLCVLAGTGGWAAARFQLRNELLPTLRLLRVDAEVPFGFEPHLYYLASWTERAGIER